MAVYPLTDNQSIFTVCQLASLVFQCYQPQNILSPILNVWMKYDFCSGANKIVKCHVLRLSFLRSWETLRILELIKVCRFCNSWSFPETCDVRCDVNKYAHTWTSDTAVTSYRHLAMAPGNFWIANVFHLAAAVSLHTWRPLRHTPSVADCPLLKDHNNCWLVPLIMWFI